MSQERKPELSEFLPKGAITRIRTVQVVAIGKKFEHFGSTLGAPFEFLDRILSCRMYGTSGKDLGVFFCKVEHMIVGYEELGFLLQAIALLVIRIIHGEKKDRIEAGSINQSEKLLLVSPVQAKTSACFENTRLSFENGFGDLIQQGVPA